MTPGTDATPEAQRITEPEAFDVLYRRYAPAVHAYLSRRAGRQLADDLLADVWLRAFRARATFDPGRGAPGPWLYGIAHNVLRAHWQRSGRPQPLLPAQLNDPWPETDARLSAEASVAALRVALLELEDTEREVLLLVAWERLSPAEAARALGIPAGTARSRLHRARASLQAALAHFDDDRTCVRPKEATP